MMREKLRVTAVLLVLVIALGFMSVREYERRQDFVFAEVVDEVVLTVDERELTLADIAFYIAYKEREIERLARIYNRENTDEYWNIHTNHTFLREEGKCAVIDMAVHDEIFYRMAVEEGIELSEEEEEHLVNDQYDFWSDLEEEQRIALGVEEDVLCESMRKLAVAEKYQYLLATMQQKEFEDYDFGGQEYLKMLEDHSYEVKESVWDRIRFGGVTYNH